MKTELMIDSGAFSAWTRQMDITVKEYTHFCLQHVHDADVIVNLDCIPGKYGEKNPSIKERRRSAKEGWSNYLYMLKHGIPKDKLLHVFHQGEEFKWLRRIVSKMGYIGLSPANDRTTEEKVEWLDRCMEYVTDNEGLPIVKFHGFAVTSLRIMLRYPWYSVDSTSWLMKSRNGQILVPRGRNGTLLYDEDPYTFFVTRSKLHEPNHLLNLPYHSSLFRHAKHYIEAKGFKIGESKVIPITEEEKETYELKEGEQFMSNGHVEKVLERGVSNYYVHRDDINLLYFHDLENHLPKWPTRFKKREIGGLLLT